jgi:tRNA (guanine-N7-)-methyltransferase
MERNCKPVIDVLVNGGLVVMRTDTIYGVVARALDVAAVQKLRAVRQRPAGDGGFIVLAPDVETVATIVKVRPALMAKLNQIWPGKVSVVLPARDSPCPWLAATDKTIAFRVPADDELRQLLHATGPLVAPSANLPGQRPARNIAEAQAYFGAAVDLYVDGGDCPSNQPSRLIKFNPDGTEQILRAAADDFVITRRRKKYKFARFNEFDNCYHLDEWRGSAALTNLTKNVNVQGDQRKSLVVEIGAGSALFLVELARRHPDQQFLAVDIKGDRLYQGARRAIELGLANINFVRADIARIADVVPAATATEIWLTFPDPWPPNSDAKHRLTAPRYLNYYRQILAQNGKLNFKTDNQPLFDWSLEQLAATGWRVEFVTRDLHNSAAPADAKIMTTYEKKFTNEGLPIYCVQVFS